MTRTARRDQPHIGGEGTDVTYQIFRALEDEQRTLSDLAAFALSSASISAGSEPSVRNALAVSLILRLVRCSGTTRLLARNEADYPTTAPAVLGTHGVWQRELAGADDVVGRALQVNGVPVTIIGVLPAGFAGHHTGLLIDVFLPLGVAIPRLPRPAGFETPNGSSLKLLGRLQEGVTREQADRQLTVAADRAARIDGEATAARQYAIKVDNWVRSRAPLGPPLPCSSSCSLPWSRSRSSWPGSTSPPCCLPVAPSGNASWRCAARSERAKAASLGRS